MANLTDLAATTMSFTCISFGKTYITIPKTSLNHLEITRILKMIN